MDSWGRVGAVDWLQADPDPTSRIGAELGFVLGRGYADESPAELGVTEAAAASLRRALELPVETADHRLIELTVTTEVNLQDTVLLLQGDLEALQHGARTLESLLEDPSPLEVTGLPDPRRSRWTGWSEELTAWFGTGPVTFAAETEDPWRGPVEELHGLTRRLHPGRSRATAAWTTEPQLVGAAFADLPGGGWSPGPLRWREPAPTAGGVGWVTATFDNNLLTARVPDTPADDVAVRLVARTVHRQLVELTQAVPGLRFSLELVGSERLLAVRAQPRVEPAGWDPVRHALVQALEASSAFLDVIVEETLEQARSAESVAADLVPAGRAMDAVRSGRPLSAEEITTGLTAVTVAEVRAGIERVRGSALLGAGADPATPDGRPRWRAPALPPVTEPVLRRRSRVGLPLGARPVRQELLATSRVLEQRLLLPRSRTGGGPPGTTAVDLTAVTARIDTGETWTTLVDREDRRLVLAWPAYRRVRPLRELVDCLTPPALRMAGGVSATHTAELRSRLRWRLARRVVPVALLVLVVAAAWLPGALRTYQEPVVSTVRLGSAVTLANGSTVQVSSAGWRKTEDLGERVRLVDVRYCGGGPTVDEHTSVTARNYVTWERFDGLGVRQVGRSALPLEPGEAPMTEGTLEQGQCLAGKLGFADEGAAPAGGRQITYGNGSGDRLAWLLG